MKFKSIIYLGIILALTTVPAFGTENDGAIVNVGDNGAETAGGSPFSQSKFVPDISLILDVTYLYRTIKNESYKNTSSPAYTLVPSEEYIHGHTEPFSRRGFNFNYAEITFASVVDPFFDLFAAFEVTEDDFGIEEGYFSTRKLPLGLQLKGGKFLSSFGRLNEQHTHYWDFHDIPLIYDAFFGEGGLNEIGARATLVVPLDFYFMIGAEVLQGKNARSFGSESYRSVDGSVNIGSGNWPDLYVAYIKSSFDIGDLVVLAGASGAFGETRINHGINKLGVSGYAVNGKTMILGGDITLKYQFDSIRYLSLQGEYLFRNIDGDYFKNDISNIASRSDFEKKQSGLYAQLVAKMDKQWGCGIRYDLLQINRVKIGRIDNNVPDNLPRYSAMLEYNPTEFSRFRLQYNCDLSRYKLEEGRYMRKINHEIIFQVNLAIGAHGAHSF